MSPLSSPSPDSSAASPQRRAFLKTGLRAGALLALGSLGYVTTTRAEKEGQVWQIDPNRCVQCGECARQCVRSQSAVRVFHYYEHCGYCQLCFGYFRPGAKRLDEGAENQICPTGAIRRTFIEEPYFQYDIIRELCIGCGLCVKGCKAFGNGSLYLQIDRELCLDCNECRIATVCPASAISRIPANRRYIENTGSSSESTQTRE